jgi:hypothetical protein
MPPIPADEPMMVVINQIWDNDTTYEQRRAFIEVTLKNSRKSTDVEVAKEIENFKLVLAINEKRTTTL